MMLADLTRSLPLEADEVDVVGRRLEGRVFSWDTLYRVSDTGGRTWYEEGYRRGCAERTIQARRNTFELRDTHEDERLGLVAFTEADDGLLFLARMDSTAEGDRELDRLRAHQRDGVSIRFAPVKQNPRTGPPNWYTQIEIRELSLTASPQLHDARVHAIRSADHPARTWHTPADIAALLEYQVPDLTQ